MAVIFGENRKSAARAANRTMPDYFTIGLPEKYRVHLADPPWQNDFVEEWRDSLQEAENAYKNSIVGDSFWEGERAARELESRGYLASLKVVEEERTREILRLVLREIEIYRHVRERSVEINREFHEAAGLLNTTLRKLRKFSSNHAAAGATTHIVGPLADEIQEVIQQLAIKKKRYWDECLDFTPRERLQPRIDREAQERGEEGVVYLLPDWAGELEYAVFNWRIPLDMTRRANLDTRLQVRLAVTFRLRLPDLSWRTIARLVVLTYICADLVQTKNGTINVPDGGELTTAKVEKKIHKAAPESDADPDAFFKA